MDLCLSRIFCAYCPKTSDLTKSLSAEGVISILVLWSWEISSFESAAITFLASLRLGFLS
jgi:hypothetical protein